MKIPKATATPGDVVVDVDTAKANPEGVALTPPGGARQSEGGKPPKGKEAGDAVR